MKIHGPIQSASAIDRDSAHTERDPSPYDEAASGFAALLAFGPDASQASKPLAKASSSASEANGSANAWRASIPALGAQRVGKLVPHGPPPSGKDLPDGALPQGAPAAPAADGEALLTAIQADDRLLRPGRAAMPPAIARRAGPVGEATNRAARVPGASGILAPEVGNPRAPHAPSHPDSIASRREMAFEAPTHSSGAARGGAGMGAWVVPPPSPLSPPADPTLDRSAVGSRGGETGAPSQPAVEIRTAARSATVAPAVMTGDGQNGDASRGAGTASLPRADNAPLPRESAPMSDGKAEEPDTERNLHAPRANIARARMPVAPAEGLRIKSVEATGRTIEGSVAPSPSLAAPGANLAAPGQSQPSSLPPPGAPSDMIRADRIEGMIDQLAHQRESARSLRGSMTVTHAEFGAIAIRIEGQGSDLRAHLSNRDPAFAPAVHHALETRAAAPAGDASGAGARHGETGQNGSTGSQQSSSQGAWAQANPQGGGAQHQDAQHRAASQGDPLGREHRADLGEGQEGGSPHARRRDGAIFA